MANEHNGTTIVPGAIADIQRAAAHNDLTASIQNLETAKLTHKRVTEQLSMRTATIAQMACALITAPGWPRGIAVLTEQWGTAAAVKIAEEIMAAAEDSAARAKELQTTLEEKV